MQLVWPFLLPSKTVVAPIRLPGVQLVPAVIEAELKNWIYGLPTAEIQFGFL